MHCLEDSDQINFMTAFWLSSPSSGVTDYILRASLQNSVFSYMYCIYGHYIVGLSEYDWLTTDGWNTSPGEVASTPAFPPMYT